VTLPRIVIERCQYLARCSEEPDAITRPFASEAMRRGHELVSEWMREAGMTVRRDNICNLRGRFEGSGQTTLLFGSHLDSVRNAGKYDGPLGVAVAIAAVQRLHDAGTRLPFAIEVLAFADEEGLRFGSTYLGSRAVGGTFDPEDLDRTDADGITMRDAIRAFGGDPERIDQDKWRGERLLGYCEVHIEQGPVLEARDLAVGVVSAIAGQERHRLTFTGEAAHAGTTPMDRRHDALAAAANFVQVVEAYAASSEGLVATVGQLTVKPGAANVVPGEVTLSLDVRHAATFGTRTTPSA
jgi:allantoate deiminase